MAYFKNMNVVNATALPMVPVDEGPAYGAKQCAARRNLADYVPCILRDPQKPSLGELEFVQHMALSGSCLVGSIHQVNERIAEVDLIPKPLDNILAFERHELEKKALKEKSHRSSEDRDRSQRKSPEVCSGSAIRNVRATSMKRRTADKNLLAELYQYPQFDDSMPNELPNGVDFCEMVGNVVRSERSLLTGRFFCSLKDLETFLSSPPIRAIWLDSFWWIFHERYQQNKEIQNKLFDRISQQYTLFLFRGSGPHYEEAILKRLPSLLSKGLYTSFSCSFPQSWLNTHEFKSDICNTVSLWISGISPSPLSYDSWDYSNLDPERFRRERLISRKTRQNKGEVPLMDFGPLCLGKEMSFFTHNVHPPYKSGHSRKAPQSQPTDGHPDSKRNSDETTQSQNTTKDFSNLLPVASPNDPNPPRCFHTNKKQRSTLAHQLPIIIITIIFANITLTDHCQTQVSKKSTQIRKISEARLAENMLPKSHPACKIPALTSNHFNLYGKSPLVVYFLLNYATLRQCGGDVLITRREITKIIPYPSLRPLPRSKAPTNGEGFSLTLKVTESSLTYADVISLTLCRMRKRKDNLMQLTKFRCSEWTYFDMYLAELQDNFLRDIKALDQREADKKRANRTFIPSSVFIEETLAKKHREDLDKETEFLLRREKEEEERYKWNDYSLPRSSRDEKFFDDSDVR
ncbi:protein FAM227A [Pipistrellus kuhlii]|uniref:protein FAM227A n=1 Tax=Pipistrellus kuhlii TaxID=59472 RepID=UPI001E2701D3|nr:protein FAM227A [Pipistrellus kuhlii]